MTDRPYMSMHESPSTDSVVAWVGRERITWDGDTLRRAAMGGDMSRLFADVYDAAKRDVRASMSPLERPVPRVIRTQNRSELVYPRRPGCSRSPRRGMPSP